MEEVLVFPSTFYMLRSEELLKRKGYALCLVPAPPQAGELCTTAIAISPHDREEIVRCLEEENILIKAVLPYESRLVRTLAVALEEIAKRYSLPAALREILDGIRGGKQIEAGGVAQLLSLALADESEAVIEAAEAMTRAYFDGRVTALVGTRLAAGSGPVRLSGSRDGAEGSGIIDLHGLAALADDMYEQGLVHLLLDLGAMNRIPWKPSELRRALGDNVIVVMTAASLPEGADLVVRDGAVRQFLLLSRDVFATGPDGLAEEIVFLRDNRPGPVGSGNLLPLLSPELRSGSREERWVRSVLAVCRLVLGDVFLPTPPPLWRKGGLSGANMLVLDATGRPLTESVREVEIRLEEMGQSLITVKRENDREEDPAREEKS